MVKLHVFWKIGEKTKTDDSAFLILIKNLVIQKYLKAWKWNGKQLASKVTVLLTIIQF